jgi:hypothetical protein
MKIKKILFTILFISTLTTAFTINAPVNTLSTLTACPGSTVGVTVNSTGFTSIGTMDLYINYDPAVMTYNSTYTTNPSLSGSFIISSAPIPGTGLNRVLVSFTTANFGTGSTLSGSTVVTLNFTYIGGSAAISFNNTEFDCEFASASLEPLNDSPTSTYYINGSIASSAPGTGSISGPASVTPGTSGLVYSTTSIPNATSYIWTVPSGFTIVSGSTTSSITVDATLSASSGNVTVKGSNTCGNGPIASYSVSTGKQLTITLFTEGLYNGTGLNKAQGEFGDEYPGTTADKITIKLHDALNYSTILNTFSNINLSTSGIATTSVPGSYSGSYYISIHHRNSIETVSASPVSFNSGTINYDFTDSATKAFGDNLKDINGTFVIYGCDSNQDGSADGLDMIDVDNQSTVFASGYLNEDLNGDGSVDAIDMIMLENNAILFIASVTP